MAAAINVGASVERQHVSPAASTAPTAPTAPTGALALSPEQCAQALGLTRTKIFALLASAQIRSVRVGKYRRIPVFEIEAFLRREIESQTPQRSA